MTTSSQRSSVRDDIADPLLYRTYYGLMLPDILTHMGHEITPEGKELLHDFHKRILGYDTISGRSQELVSRFLQDVCILWAEMGIFVRTSGKQPWGIEDMDFWDIKHLL